MSKSSLSSLTQESNDDDIVFRKKRNKSHPQIGDIDSVKIGNTNYKISSSIHPDKRFDAEKRLLTSYNYFTTDSPTRSIEKSKYILMEMLDYDELKSYNPKPRNTIKKRMKKKKKGGKKKKTKKNKKLQRKKKGGTTDESDNLNNILNEIFSQDTNVKLDNNQKSVNYQKLINEIEKNENFGDNVISTLENSKKDTMWNIYKGHYKKNYNYLKANEGTIKNLINKKDDSDNIIEKYDAFIIALKGVLDEEQK